MTMNTDEQQLSDPRPGFAGATDQARAIIAAVTDDHLRLPTPCSEFDVEDLTRHLISIAHRTVAIGQGREAESVPLDAPGVAVGDWAAEWDRATAEIDTIWADDSLLGTDMVLPFATLPGAAALAIYTAEILVHSWDLASALSLRPDWNQGLAGVAYVVISQGIPAEGRGPEMPFDPVVPTAPDAPAMDRLVAWVGRNPAANAAA